ncbi:TRAP transporter substrate-binding protein [Afifella sp. IM 167]|uniref:TRAP transporter substrate-binding protein n=1 Tax=Afifella sp. IM 167 TaxID=2033586 RepID=UPI001CCC6F4D|nr:TRAP transporter substrate-binding protein [Afifella sp. IM 167]MBZ8135433.1 C4-dicarboxylate ABC transporter substrate-binding protein [Afifella sp. IM 167]
MLVRALAFVLALACTTLPALAQEYTIRLSHGDNETNPTHITALKFKELVDKYSDGKIAVQIFPANQLGSEEEVIRAVRNNTIQAQIPAMANVHPVAPSVGVLLLPYLFSNSEEAHAGLDALLPALNEHVTKEAGIRFVGILEKGFRVLTNSKRAVETIDDLKGLKIRVPPNEISIKTFRSWGVEPVPMGWAEVFTALQQGVIDGQENPYTTAVTSKFYEIQKYITEVHYQIWTGPLLISEAFYQKLSPELQDAVDRAGLEAVQVGREANAEQTAEAMAFLKEHGMTLSGAPQDEEKWREAARGIWGDFYANVGGEEWANQAIKIVEDAVASK